MIRNDIVKADGLWRSLYFVIGVFCAMNAYGCGELIVPASAKCIGPYAFKEFTGLRKVVVEDGVEIEHDAFRGCTSLVEVVILARQKIIPERAFVGCVSLERVVLPESLEAIGLGAFAGCSSLETFDLPKNFQGFLGPCFQKCDRLRAFSVAEGNDFLKAVDGIVYTKDGTGLMMAPNLYENDELRIPEGVRRIVNSFQFQFTKGLKKVVLPSSMESIGGGFWGVSDIEWFEVDRNSAALASREGVLYSANGRVLWRCPPNYFRKVVEVAEGVEVIGFCAFEYCRYVESIVLPTSVKELQREWAFSNCRSLRQITLPDTIDIGYNCFMASPNLADIRLIKNGGSLVSKGGFLSDARTGELLYCAPVFTNGVLRLPDGILEVRPGAFTNIRETYRVEMPPTVKEVRLSDFVRNPAIAEVVFEGDCPLLLDCVANHPIRLYVDFKYPGWRSITTVVAESESYRTNITMMNVGGEGAIAK